MLVWAGMALVPFSAGDPVVRDYFRFISHLNINLRHLEAGVWLLLLVALGFGLRRFLRRARLMELQLGLITMLSVLALTLTPNGISPVNHRYLYLGVVSLVPLAGFMLVLRLRKVPRVTGLVTVALLAAVLLNGAASVGGLRGARTGDESTRRIVRAVSAAGVDKGYANYWSASQITWSWRRAAVAVPLVCEHIDGSTPRLARCDWLINRVDLDRPATRTFLVVETERDDRGHDLGCLGGARLPTPYQVVRVDRWTEIRFYNSDIGAGLPLFRLGD
ncbi:hypothetical protein CGZ93_03410 [Enemella dayhoffiae]|uniref:Uncharacterized protein n=1 Tax=Enemella dayhoffiae TaxID=2016507 RepID=A0A255H9W1_9ACTN|nr:hypothetical protein [Enemella dayhoffiae]OYO24451.1 hypothetical protein CGZ93_03410 [Enemella dayhoffiae]